MAPLSENAAHSPEKRADSPVENGDSLLLAGDYNEAESAAEFQAALRQWRGEDSVVPKPPPRPRPPPVSPVRSPIVSMEHGTGTESGLEPQAPDIKFHSSLTYAEKLMLKRHRRTELKPLPDDLRSRSENRSRSSEYPPLEQLMTSRSETLVMDGPEETLVEVLREPTVDAPDDGITWRDMHRAMKSDSIIRSESRSESRVSIIELNEDIPVKSRRRGRGSDVEQTSKYKVSLVGREEDLELLSARKQSARGAKVNPSSSAKRRDKSTMLPPSASTYEETSLKHSRKVTKNTEVDDTPDLSIDLSASKKGQSSRPKSNARPRSSRVKSSRAGQSRPQSRAMSRTETRLAFYGEGELTKAPSESLKEVARMTPRHDPTPFIPTMGEFFTNGVVTQEEVRDRVMTPRKNRVKSKEVANDAGIPKWKVSYNLYNMGPRSWKPDASLKDQVDDDVAVVTIEETSDRLRDFLEPDTDDKRLETVSYSITEGVSRTESTFIDQKKSKSFSREDTSKVTTSARSRTPRVTSSRGMPQTSVRSATDTERTPRPDTERTPRPDSRAIVVDGDDLSSYDFNQETTEMNDEDEDSLYQLEWELASHDGRITEDGTLSRLSIAITPEADEEQSDVTPEVPLAMGVSSLIAGAASPGASLDTRMNHLMDDFEEMEEKLLDAEEVKALH